MGGVAMHPGDPVHSAPQGGAPSIPLLPAGARGTWQPELSSEQRNFGPEFRSTMNPAAEKGPWRDSGPAP